MIRITTNAKNVLQSLEAYKRNLMEERFKAFLENLAQLGVVTANAKLQEAKYSGTNDVVIEEPTWLDDKTLALTASGHAVTFIEFGTGVTYEDNHPWAAKVGAVRGEFGYKLGRLDTWRYPAEHGKGNGDAVEDDKHEGYLKTHGNPPGRFMYEASKEMRDKIAELAKEMFMK